MTKIALVTDSTSDLSPQMVSRFGAHTVPLYVLYDGKNLKDGLEITSKAILEGVGRGVKIPSTSQPSPAEFADAYRKALETADEVLSLHISGKLSGTVGSARLAAQDFGGKVTVLDALTTTGGLALQVWRASELIAAGHNMADIVQTLERVHPRMTLRFTVDSLDFLRKNGRIGGAQAMIGSLLGIKPVLKVEDGKVEPAARVRGKSKVIEDLVEHTQKYLETHREARIAYLISPGGEEALAQVRAKLVGLPLHELGTVTIGSVITTHVGPGAVGVALEPAQV